MSHNVKEPATPAPLMRSAQCAAYLCVSRAHLERMRYEGTGPRYTKVSPKVILYARADVDAWLAARAAGPAAATA